MRRLEHGGGVARRGEPPRFGCAPSRFQAAQATVEYAVVLTVFLAILAACALLAHAAGEGALADVAEQGASHGMGGLGWIDIALY